MSLIGLIVALVIVCLAVWAVQTITAAFNIPPQIRAVMLVLVVVIAVIYLLGLVGFAPVMRLR